MKKVSWIMTQFILLLVSLLGFGCSTSKRADINQEGRDDVRLPATCEERLLKLFDCEGVKGVRRLAYDKKNDGEFIGVSLTLTGVKNIGDHHKTFVISRDNLKTPSTIRVFDVRITEFGRTPDVFDLVRMPSEQMLQYLVEIK